MWLHECIMFTSLAHQMTDKKRVHFHNESQDSRWVTCVENGNGAENQNQLFSNSHQSLSVAASLKQTED